MLQQPRVPAVEFEGAADQPPTRPRAAPKYEAQCVLIDDEGRASFTTLRKQRLVSELQLRHRDIRALEPGVALPYPAAIFVRKQALVLNLEGLKVIVSRDRTLVISVPRADDLSARMKPTLDSPAITRMSAMIAMRYDPAGGDSGAALEEFRHLASQPYELRALEGALLVAVSALGREVAALESVASPVLARIRRQVERADLEAIFEVQNRLDKAVSRTARIKEVLEELLDDEDEMAGMCLSRCDPGHETSGVAAAAAVSAAVAAVAAQGVQPGGPEGQRADGGSAGNNGDGDGDSPFAGELEPRLSCKSVSMDMGSEEVSELEDMIEAHWLQVDSLLSRLTLVQERIRNTEHLVNLDLDSKRNALVGLGLVIDVFLAALEVHMAVTGIFGMNLTSGLERWQPWSLWGLVVGAAVVGAMLSLGTLRYVRRRGLLRVPAFGLGPAGAAAV